MIAEVIFTSLVPHGVVGALLHILNKMVEQCEINGNDERIS